MSTYREVTPIKGPEAFEERGWDAILSQSAIVLAAGVGVAGAAAQLERPADMALPDLASIEYRDRIDVGEAVATLDIDVATHVGDPNLRIPAADSAPIAKRLVDDPDPMTAAALVEVNLHSPHPLVRTAAAASALDTTGPREDVVARLVEASHNRDPLTRDLGRVALARVDPDHEALRNVVGPPAPLNGRHGKSHTAVVTHGTFASRTRWWRPGGTFYGYLDGLNPPLHMHDPSFQWTGQYSPGARDLAASRLEAWIPDQGLQTPDFFAHSHGGTVANLATTKGAEFDRLVLLSWPVHDVWFPDFTKAQRIIDVRVRWDLVIMADRGGQVFRPPAQHANKVEAHINGWFDHSDTHDPGYWENYGLPAVL